eukprot:gnl/TRDRNA2_/TRDRNA2_39833_c0_seq1.p1 gnl/TRDRNA2_/TRDRNA2_39833_c0~~gnl/TRDRNA2_/TRDRNA2_39833_c0_seq1.p1  ORF type:complete len:509 (+),score=100.09 gnl/TRDRNA2_/TRDRNA2_39833_c0_seq1:24-1550(+)
MKPDREAESKSREPPTQHRYGELLCNLDQAIQLEDVHTARQRHEALADFVRDLSDDDRRKLEPDGDVAGWSHARRQQLRARWQSLKVHCGSWAEWTVKAHASTQWTVETLDREQSGEDDGQEQAPSREDLLNSARDLAHRKDPGSHRRDFWLFCIGGLADPEVSEKPLDRAESDQIALDVARTPNLSDEQREVLIRILQRHCVLPEHASTGYIQGMHMLAACPLWVGLDEAEAFSVLQHMLARVNGCYFADKDFATFRRDVRVVEALITERLPHLSKSLAAAETPAMLLTFDPFLCLFTHHMPGASAVRLWDMLLLEGDVAVFAVLLVLLELLLPDECNGAVAEEGVPDESAGENENGSRQKGAHGVEPAPLKPPLAELFRQRSSGMSSEEVEHVLRRVRAMLDVGEPVVPPDDGEAVALSIGTGTLAQRVAELRSEASGNGSGAWWDLSFGQLVPSALSMRFNGWWASPVVEGKVPEPDAVAASAEGERAEVEDQPSASSGASCRQS